MPAPRPSRAEPLLGAVLAGGAARRFGGRKMQALHRGRPLPAWALDALRAATRDVVVVAKRGVELPALGVEVWREPDEPRHPLAGIAWALGRAGGRDVLVCAGDMPDVPSELVRVLARAPGEVAVVRGPGGPEPLLARYPAAAAPVLARAAAAGAPARAAVAALAPTWVDWPDAPALRSLNAPADLGA